MIEFDNQVYLSAYAVPYFDKPLNWGGEIRSLLDILNEMDYDTITDEYVLNLFKDHYKAVLFICDKNNGDLKTFYTVDSAIGSNFLIENGNLTWNVEYFENMTYSVATSSFTFGGVTRVYNYMYDEKGRFIGVNKTDNLRIFRK